MTEPSTDGDVRVLPFLSSLGIKDLRKSARSVVSVSSEPEGSPLCWDIDSLSYHGESKCVLDVLSVSVQEVCLGRSLTDRPLKALVQYSKDLVLLEMRLDGHRVSLRGHWMEEWFLCPKSRQWWFWAG